MSVKTQIVDGKGSGHRAHVTLDHALLVSSRERSITEISPEELTKRKLFFEYMRRESDNSRDMNVDGSSTPQEFILGAEDGAVRWVANVRMIIEGNNFDLKSSGDFRRWGSVAIDPGLTNGIELYSVQGGEQSKIFYDPVKNMGDLFRYQTDYLNFVNAIDSQADYLSIDIDMPADVALPLGVNDKIVCVVNDNLVDANFIKLQVLVRGTQEIL